MASDSSFLNMRYRQQVGWTADMRRYLFKKAGILPDDSNLEVGCGSGAVLDALVNEGYQRITGIDIDFSILAINKDDHPTSCADGLLLPFKDATFDHTICHFYLMWVRDPLLALREMARVTAPDGWVFALAEPDYGGRIDHPESLAEMGKMQSEALRERGADIMMGRKLLSLFRSYGLGKISAGIIGANWDSKSDMFTADMDVLRRDLTEMTSQERLEGLLTDALVHTKENGALWYVPVFYACGQVPDGG